ncbi:MAG: deoxyhypusine synthase family protein, partial [Methanobacteriota archaeon]
MRRRDFLREPIRHLDLDRIESIGELVESFRYTSFQSRNLARCLDVYRNMLESRRRVTVFLGLSGAMTPGGMRKIIRDMIEQNLVDVIVSTGANLYHDLAEAFGSVHFLGSPLADDLELKKLDIDRIYDTFADEKKFKALGSFFAEFLDSLEPRAYSSREFLELLGR